jgi:hypothetical protein
MDCVNHSLNGYRFLCGMLYAAELPGLLSLGVEKAQSAVAGPMNSPTG